MNVIICKNVDMKKYKHSPLENVIESELNLYTTYIMFKFVIILQKKWSTFNKPILEYSHILIYIAYYRFRVIFSNLKYLRIIYWYNDVITKFIL